jgi:hypothetical protein
MKHFLTTILFFALTSTLLSQNWKPINTSLKYNYEIDTADYITNTIWIDSVKVIDEDSVFYLNRIMIIDPVDDYYVYKNQGQFLMKQTRKVSDSLYTFSDSVEFHIRPLAHLSETWLFNEDDLVYAEVIEESKELIFEQEDSVKLIQLTNGKQVKLSKNFGIIEFFDWDSDAVYNLVGIEGDIEYGEQVPDFWDFYDFQVGDTIEMHDYYISYCYPYHENCTWEKFCINSVQQTEDEVICQISGLYYHSHGDSYSGHISYAGYLNRVDTYTYSQATFLNAYNHEMIYVNDYFDTCYSPTYGNLKCEKENELYIKRLNYYISTNSPEYFYVVSNGDLMTAAGYYELNFTDATIVYTETLGLTRYEKSNFVTGEDAYIDIIEQTGYIRDGITYGSVHPNSWYISDNIEVREKNFKIWPNPANETLNISVDGDHSKRYEIEIFDITGKKVISKTEEKDNFLIDINNLLQGIYLLSIQSENINYTSKFIKN